MRLILSILYLSLGACTGPVVVPEAGEFEIGTGTWRFEAVEDGQALDLVRGAQGGWHVWIAVRGNHIEDGDTIILETEPADGSEEPQRVELTPNFDPPNSEGFRNYLGWPAMLAEPECLVGNLLRIRATWRSANGETMTSERDIEVAPGADPPEACP